MASDTVWAFDPDRLSNLELAIQSRLGAETAQLKHFSNLSTQGPENIGCKIRKNIESPMHTAPTDRNVVGAVSAIILDFPYLCTQKRKAEGRLIDLLLINQML